MRGYTEVTFGLASSIWGETWQSHQVVLTLKDAQLQNRRNVGFSCSDIISLIWSAYPVSKHLDSLKLFKCTVAHEHNDKLKLGASRRPPAWWQLPHCLKPSLSKVLVSYLWGAHRFLACFSAWDLLLHSAVLVWTEWESTRKVNQAAGCFTSATSNAGDHDQADELSTPVSL